MGTAAKPPCDDGVLLAGACDGVQRSGRAVLATAILGSSMVFIDGTVVTVALPAMQTAFSATIADVQWFVESYALLLSALLLAGGSVGDIYGRRRVFAAGVAVFAVASAWCGLASSAGQLIIARGVQGAGGALLVPNSLALISSSFSEADRGRAIGTWSGFTSITAAIGPVLGGWLVEHGSWRAVFFVNVPVAAAVLALVRRVPECRTPAHAAPRLDWLGTSLAALGLGGIVYAFLESGPAAAAIGVAALGAFLLVEARSAAPRGSGGRHQQRRITCGRPAGHRGARRAVDQRLQHRLRPASRSPPRAGRRAPGDRQPALAARVGPNN